MGWLRRLVFGSALCVAAHGQVVLNFQDLTLLDYGIIPSTYGSNLTANLSSISYRTFTLGTNVTLTNYLEFWNSGYGDLDKVAFASSNGYAAEVSINPAPGFGVRLVSFDLAGWPNLDRTLPNLRLLDSAGNVLLNYTANGPVAIQGDLVGARHTTFTPNLVSNGAIRIQWGNDWDIGIDNIQFQIVPIPEPPVWALLLLGGSVVAWRVRRGSSRPPS